MNEVNVLKVKRLHPDAVFPSRAHDNDSGWDLVAIEDGTIQEGEILEGSYLQYKTGWAIEIPKGYDAFLFPRSSIRKYDLTLANGIGLIDEGYRGELIVCFKPAGRWTSGTAGGKFCGFSSDHISTYKKGDKIAQLVLRKRPEFVLEEVESLSDSERSSGGFGSTDSKGITVGGNS